METVNLFLLMKNQLRIFPDATRSSKKRKEKQKLTDVDFATKINTMNMNIKMLNAPRLKM